MLSLLCFYTSYSILFIYLLVDVHKRLVSFSGLCNVLWGWYLKKIICILKTVKLVYQKCSVVLFYSHIQLLISLSGFSREIHRLNMFKNIHFFCIWAHGITICSLILVRNLKILLFLFIQILAQIDNGFIRSFYFLISCNSFLCKT